MDFLCTPQLFHWTAMAFAEIIDNEEGDGTGRQPRFKRGAIWLNEISSS